MSDGIIMKYLTYLKKERGYSEHTVDAYKIDLFRFDRFIQNYSIRLIGADQNHIHDFIEYELNSYKFHKPHININEEINVYKKNIIRGTANWRSSSR